MHLYNIVLFSNDKIVIILFCITASNNGCKLNTSITGLYLTYLTFLNSCGNIPNINIGV